MKVSLSTIKQLLDFELPPIDQLVEKINMQLGGVEEVIDLGDKYKDAVIVRVVECEKHPNADKLSVCMIDAGDSNSELLTPNSELIQVVCGAPNVHADMWAVWLPPGATVPSSYGDPSPFVLDAREIRGVVSNGMLAAADELAIGSDHAGIIELTDNDLHPTSSVQHLASGQNFAEVFGLNDTIIDIENKMFTHRPDLFGQLGVAREIAGIQQHQFVSPDWYKNTPEFQSATGLELRVENNASELVPRFMAVAIKDVGVRQSPLWLQCALVAMGGKPINNIVDATNYVMLLTAQPTHAYDYDKLRGNYLGTRMAKSGEELSLLNGKTYMLDETDIVIVDGEGPVGLAGIMGGGNSEVSSDTKNIVLEVANFDMYAVRKSSMRHGLFTDALTRFNKGQSALQNAIVLHLLMQSVFDVAGGVQASDVCDEKGAIKEVQTVQTTPEFINGRLGLNLDEKQIETLLSNVEFGVDINEGARWFKAPFWRTDIEQPEDIVEEVGRLYGFDKLPRELPRRSIKPAATNSLLETGRRIRDSLSRAGANEVLTYSFVHENIMKKSEQDVGQAFALSNALSPDLQYYRLSVLPSLLDRVHQNIKSGYDEFALFEIGKGHNKKYHADDDDGLPTELEFVDMVYASKKPRSGAAYYHVRRMVTQLVSDLGFTLKFDTITEPLDYPVTASFDLTRSALVHSRSGEFIGMIGELKQSVQHAFKLPDYTAAMSLDLEGLHKASCASSRSYTPLSRYPSVTQDISLKVSNDVTYEQVFWCVRDAIATQDKDSNAFYISPRGVYRARDEDTHKTITLRVEMTSYDRTLTDSEVSKSLESASAAAAKMFSAVTV